MSGSQANENNNNEEDIRVKELPVMHKQWLNEARRQVDIALKIENDLTSKIDFMTKLIISAFGVMISIWSFTGIPNNYVVNSIIVILFLTIIFIFWRISETLNTPILNIEKELLAYSNNDLLAENYQFWRLISGLDQMSRTVHSINSQHGIWYDRYIRVTIVFLLSLLISLFY